MNKMKTILLAMATVGILSGLAVAQNGDYRNNDNNNYGNHRDADNYSFGQNRNSDAREYGMHLGYRDGFNQGRINRASSTNNSNRRNGRYNSNGSYDNRDYNYNYNNGNASPRNDTAGYQQWMGPRGQFKQGYREGFRNGFNDANNGRRTQYGYVYGQNGQRTPWDPDGDGRPGVTVNNGGNNGNYGNWTTGGRGNGSATRFGAEDGQKAGQSDRQSGHSSRATEWASYRDADHGLSSSTGYGSSDQYKQEYRQAFVNEYNQSFGYRR